MCKAQIWKKGILVICSEKSKESFCRFHTKYNENWLNTDLFTICKRCNKGFNKTGKVRCNNCNLKDKKPKKSPCIFIKKDKTQCTNQQKFEKYCGTHKKYAELGITPENRCLDCGNQNDTNNRICSNCQNNRSLRAKEKRKKNKLVKINKVMTTLNSEEYEISPFYLAGFFDGDGSICITQGLSLQIQFSQSVLSILNKIKSIFGGSLYSRDGKNENQRRQHTLRFCGRDCEKLLKYLDIGCIMKWDQIQVAKKFINLNNLQGLEDRKIQLREKMRKLNKAYKKTHNKPYDKINWEYIAGIFDAEGCIYMRQRQKKNGKDFRYLFGYIKICQKNDFQLLNKIRDFIGHGRTNDKVCWKTERIDFAKFDLTKIYPLLIVKKKQAKDCIEFLDCNDNDRKKELYNQIKIDKHNKTISII